MLRLRSRSRGLGLVELVISVSILGVVLTAGTTAVMGKIRESRRTEALDTLAKIRDSVSQSGAHDHIGAVRSGRLARLVGGDRVQELCHSAVPVPARFELVAGGQQYQPSAAEWASGSRKAGWRCLHMSGLASQRYQFGYNTQAATVSEATEGYWAWARGDLDGDGRASFFRISGNVVAGRVVHDEKVTIVDGAE